MDDEPIQQVIDDTTNQEPTLEQDDEGLTEVIDDEQPAEAPAVEDFGPEIPVPVEVTGKVYSDFKEAFGEDQAALLQKKWGDKAFQNEGVVRAVMEDHPDFDGVYADHQSEDGGISVQGLSLAAEYLAKETGFNDLEELSKAWPELDAIILDNYDERTQTVSAVGIYQALAYIGQRSGYRYTYREKRT